MIAERGQRCVITGMGVISSIGHNLAEYAAALRAGHCGIGRMRTMAESAAPFHIGAEIHDFAFDDALNCLHAVSDELLKKAKRAAKRSPLAVQCSVITGLQAWQDAELDQKPVDPMRIGVVIAGSNLTQSYQYEMTSKYGGEREYLPPSYALHFLDTDQVGTLSEILNIQGEGFSVGGASASGNVALIKGWHMVQLGLVDVCLVIGSLADLSPMELQGFHSIGAMGGKRFAHAPEKACRPFDASHEGFIYGQGSGCVVLESEESANRRGATPWAEFMGGRIILDANRLCDPTEKGEASAMEAALAQAGLTAGHVDYINTHGTSSPLGDQTEIQAIRRVFGERVAEIWMNATKGLIGHCLYSAGILEVIATVIQLQEGFVHPNRNLDQPIDQGCRFSGTDAVTQTISVAMSNSFGFGGINTSVILKRGSAEE